MNSKRKGSAFEREVCQRLSYWISGGKREDIFWRSAMSGGRATVHGEKVRQAGDICAVAPEGHAFCNQFYVECKHVKKLALDQFIVQGTGPLATFWRKARTESSKRHLDTMVIARQNGWPTLVFCNHSVDFADGVKLATFDNWGVSMIAFDEMLALEPPKFRVVR